MRFVITDDQNRADWEQFLGHEVGREVYINHDFYLRNRDMILTIQGQASVRAAERLA